MLDGSDVSETEGIETDDIELESLPDRPPVDSVNFENLIFGYFQRIHDTAYNVE